jgi:hypothetical protein
LLQYVCVDGCIRGENRTEVENLKSYSDAF